MLVLRKHSGDAAIKSEHLADALDDHLDAALRISDLLQREHEAINDGFAFGLRLNRGKESRVGNRLGSLRGKDFQKLHVALAKASGTIRHIDEADQLALDKKRHNQCGANLIARNKVLIETLIA